MLAHALVSKAAKGCTPLMAFAAGPVAPCLLHDARDLLQVGFRFYCICMIDPITVDT